MELSALVVEDERDFTSLLARFLRSDGFDVVAATSAEEASDAILSSAIIDVIVCDFYLQHSTASHFLDLVNEHRPNTPVILMSGGNAQIPIESVHAIGAVSGAICFLQKPFTRTDLLCAVRQALKR